jgi:hypothetical protein
MAEIDGSFFKWPPLPVDPQEVILDHGYQEYHNTITGRIGTFSDNMPYINSNDIGAEIPTMVKAPITRPGTPESYTFQYESTFWPPSSTVDSSRSSWSQHTNKRRLPPGQRRLDEGVASDFRLSTASSDFQSISTYHSLQHRQLSELQDEDGGSYIRTPELRVSHKLAERKRRTEMKELFDTLSARQHHERGSKASK